MIQYGVYKIPSRPGHIYNYLRSESPDFVFAFIHLSLRSKPKITFSASPSWSPSALSSLQKGPSLRDSKRLLSIVQTNTKNNLIVQVANIQALEHTFIISEGRLRSPRPCNDRHVREIRPTLSAAAVGSILRKPDILIPGPGKVRDTAVQNFVSTSDQICVSVLSNDGPWPLHST